MLVDFCDLLGKHSIDPAQVLMLRHTPKEAQLRQRLRWVAADHEQALIDYQSSHGRKVEEQLQRARYIASFIGDAKMAAIFVGLFAITGHRHVPQDHWLTNPVLHALVGPDWQNRDARTEIAWFDQERVDFYPDWRGKLVVQWPSPAILYSRWAKPGDFPIHAIHGEQQLIDPIGAWDEIIVSWADLAMLPPAHRAILASWRGIYFIRDSHDGARYVGAAYGAQNLLGRWESYSQTGHGGNVRMLGRDPTRFTFSILELMAPDAPAKLVQARERLWKDRLGTRSSFDMNAN